MFTSEEIDMTRYAINGIQIEVETRGDENAPAFLLIRGLSTQLVHWPESFLDLLWRLDSAP